MIRKHLAAFLFAIVAIAALGMNFYGMVHPLSPSKGKIVDAFCGPGDRDIDPIYTNAPAHGNVLLRFHDCAPIDNHFLGLAYLRSVYVLYPRKVYATSSTNTVNYPRDLLRAPLDPSEEWLDDQEISFIVDFTCIAHSTIVSKGTARTVKRP